MRNLQTTYIIENMGVGDEIILSHSNYENGTIDIEIYKIVTIEPEELLHFNEEDFVLKNLSYTETKLTKVIEGVEPNVKVIITTNFVD